MFCALSQNYQHCFERLYVHFIVNFAKELKNGIKVLELLIKTFLTVFIYNLKTAWPTKIPMPFLSSLDNLLLHACISQKSVDSFEIAHKTC